MTFATPAKSLEPVKDSNEIISIASPKKLLDPVKDSTEVMTFGSDDKLGDNEGKGSTEVVPFGSDTKPDKTKEASVETVEAPPRPDAPAPPNKLNLPTLKEAKETDFLAKLDPIIKATAKLQKKSVPGEKKLTTRMNRIIAQAKRAIATRLKATLRIIAKSKNIADDKRAEFKKRVEDVVAKTSADIDTYYKKLADSVPKKMETMTNTDLFERIRKLVESQATKRMDTVKYLQQLTTQLLTGINVRFGPADTEMSKYTM